MALCLVLPCAFLALAGAGTLTQWLVLRRWLPGAADWPLHTAGGILAGAPFLAWAFFDPANRSDGANVLLFALFWPVYEAVWVWANALYAGRAAACCRTPARRRPRRPRQSFSQAVASRAKREARP